MTTKCIKHLFYRFCKATFKRLFINLHYCFSQISCNGVFGRSWGVSALRLSGKIKINTAFFRDTNKRTLALNTRKNVLGLTLWEWGPFHVMGDVWTDGSWKVKLRLSYRTFSFWIIAHQADLTDHSHWQKLSSLWAWFVLPKKVTIWPNLGPTTPHN